MTDEAAQRQDADYDVVIIGAGISGMYMLHRLRELGMTARVIEAGTDVGGTWYWNRYPGARFDSESYSYGYSFSEELLEEWEWAEHFAPQPETLRYCNFVADKFDLRRDMDFNSTVRSAHFDDDNDVWKVETEEGRKVKGRFLITAIGVFAKPMMPAIDGVDDFEGEAYHTGTWPHRPIGFEGKRVAVIGTGATGVQTIQEVAKTAGQLTVFQRTPNWCAPLHNRPITEEEQREIKEKYPEIFAICRASFAGFMHDADHRRALQTPPEEREAFYEKLYGEPGFGIWMGNFRDMLVDERANATMSEFAARKIRERVDDPVVAEKLIPTNHGFGTRRVPLETRYYEVYNQDNVRLVDLHETPITRITPAGIETGDESFDFDMIIFATGFDAVTGGYEQIDFRGVGGRKLKDKWAGGVRTFLGLQIEGFPNMFTLVGPHNAASFCNIPRCIEQNVDWMTDLLRHARDEGYNRIETTAQAEEEWTAHVHLMADRMLFSKTDSWFTGINSNLPGRDQRTVLLYAGGAPAYRDKCDEVAAAGYQGMVLG